MCDSSALTFTGYTDTLSSQLDAKVDPETGVNVQGITTGKAH